MHGELLDKVLKRATGVNLTSQISSPPTPTVYPLLVKGIIIQTPFLTSFWLSSQSWLNFVLGVGVIIRLAYDLMYHHKEVVSFPNRLWRTDTPLYSELFVQTHLAFPLSEIILWKSVSWSIFHRWLTPVLFVIICVCGVGGCLSARIGLE